MTQQQIIIQIFTVILTAFVASFSKSIFDKIFDAYKPDIKKAISVTKKYLVFTLRYLLPAVYIIFLLSKTDTVDKYFVFSLAILCSSFVLNITIDLNNQQLNRHVSTLRQQKEIMEQMHSIAQAGILTTENLSNLTSVARQQIDIMRDLIKTLKNNIR